jgi:hypothetical protein
LRFIENMSVGRKLAVAFGVVLAAIAVMGVVVVTNLLALQRADHARNLEGEINQVLAVAEFGPQPAESFVRLRGNVHAKGPKVELGFPRMLAAGMPAGPVLAARS